ncbi:MAG: putative ABC transport system permease protein [Acidimicrobiales bacterium]|jgi:putative ABC transport system permease protein
MMGRSKPLRWRSRLRPSDVVSTGTVRIRTRRMRAAFTAVGIAIGIASMVAVLGISSSSKADILSTLDDLGTNLLQVRPGTSFLGDATPLSADAPSMVRRVGPVESATSLSKIDAPAQRNDRVAENHQNGVDVYGSETNLAATLGAKLAAGRHHDEASVTLPTVVLGAVAAERLGITDVDDGARVYIGGEWFAVIGIYEPLPLNPDIDRAALIGLDAARDRFGVKGLPSAIYVRTHPDQVEAVRDVLARTASPGNPNEVEVSRLSDALAARAAVDQRLQTLLLALGGVALLVGGIGIANVMIISVLERRAEIGLRRALGATRGHIRNQFVVESSLLSLLGGLLGAATGYAVTAIYASRQGWTVSVPMQGLVLGVLAALVIGAVAGLYPAFRAARLDPAEAIRPAA